VWRGFIYSKAKRTSEQNIKYKIPKRENIKYRRFLPVCVIGQLVQLAPSAQQAALPAIADSCRLTSWLRDHTGQKRRYWLVLKEIIRAAPCFFLRVLAWY
jgi:hypothetical protein